MRILFDQGVPSPLRPYLQGHDVRTALHMRWDRLRNGELLDAAEAAGFDVFVTTDRNLRYQQNLALRRIAILVLTDAQWPKLRESALEAAAITAAAPGSYSEFRHG
jgi:hypothetical protein